MRGWDYRLATAAGISLIAAALIIGVPAISHRDVIPHPAWITGIVLMALAAGLFTASVAASIINWMKDRKKRRNDHA